MAANDDLRRCLRALQENKRARAHDKRRVPPPIFWSWLCGAAPAEVFYQFPAWLKDFLTRDEKGSPTEGGGETGSATFSA